MPLINVKVIAGVFSPEQKSQIIRNLTNAMVEIEVNGCAPVTWTGGDACRGGQESPEAACQ